MCFRTHSDSEKILTIFIHPNSFCFIRRWFFRHVQSLTATHGRYEFQINK